MAVRRVTARGRAPLALALALGCASCAHAPGAGPRPVGLAPSGTAAEQKAAAADSAAIRKAVLEEFQHRTAMLDSLRKLGPLADSIAIARAAAESTAAESAAAAITAGGHAVGPPAPRRTTAAAAEPELHLAADNVTGTHGPTGDEVLLNGNVRITRERTVITSEHGRYQRALGLLDLDGRVKMVDSTTTVTCDHASYAEKSDVLTVMGNVEMHDRDAVLRAPFGTYDRRTGRVDLNGPVEGRDSTQRMVSDHAIYLRDSLLVHARGHVRAFDDPNRIEMDSDAMDYDRRTHLAVATVDPVLKATDKDGRVALIRALKLQLNTATKVAEAIDSVRVTRDTLQARADRARFDDRADRGWLTGNPRVWDNETVVTGDSIEIQTNQRTLQRVIVRRNAIMDYAGIRPGSKGEKSRLTGQRVDVYFNKDDIDSLVATRDARDEYQGVARAGKTGERNTAVGDTITVFFKERKIDRARVEGKASGEYHLPVDPADTTAIKKEIVKYDARRIEFQVPKSKIVLDRDAHLIYQDLELHAKRVEYDINQQTLEAEGKPELIDRGDKVTGQLMTYDMDSRVGTIYGAETSYERGLYHGEQIRKVGDNELDVLHGAYSTCDLPQPHYHFAARWMKIYLKDKLVAKPVVFYIKNVPILALPFWVFPIKSGRHSGFLFPQFELGVNNRAGQFVRNAGYYWAPNDYLDLTASGDYYQAEPSWVGRVEGDYKLLYKLEGDFNGSYARDEALKTENWDFNADHSEELTPRTHLVARAQFVSSRDYNSSDLYGRSLAQRLNRFLTSSIAVSHAADWANVSFVVDRRQDIDADQSLLASPASTTPIGTPASLPNLTESEPNITVSFPTRTIGGLGFLKGTGLEKPLSTLYFNFTSQFLSLRQRQAFVSGTQRFLTDSTLDSTVVLGQSVTVRRALATSSFLSDSRRLWGWLNFAPRVSTNMVVFDFDEQGHKVVPAATWSSALSMSTSLYGTLRTHVGPLIGLRHIVVPSVSITYSPEFRSLTFTDTAGVRRSRFNGFGGIGISGFESAFLTMSLEQRLQAKLQHGEQVQRLDNLATFTLSTNYNLLYREQGQIHALSPVSANLFIQPPGVMNGSATWTMDPYDPRPLRNFSYSLGLNLASRGAHVSATPDLPVDQSKRTEPGFNEDWSLGLAYSYAGGYTLGTQWASQQNANAVLRYQFSPGWGLEYSTSYDATLHQVGTQRFGLTRDLHCWTASFTRTFIAGGEAEYYFRIGVKDQREIYLERGTRVGSLGGIQ